MLQNDLAVSVAVDLWEYDRKRLKPFTFHCYCEVLLKICLAVKFNSRKVGDSGRSLTNKGYSRVMERQCLSPLHGI